MSTKLSELIFKSMNSVTVITVALSLGFICLAFSSVEGNATKTANSSGKQLSQNSTVKSNAVCNVIHNYNLRGTSCQETKALLYHMSKQLNDVKKQLDEVQTAVESLTKGVNADRTRSSLRARARERMETSPVWTLACIHAGRFLFFFLLNDQRERGLPSVVIFSSFLFYQMQI